jgi:hypothetical protein
MEELADLRKLYTSSRIPDSILTMDGVERQIRRSSNCGTGRAWGTDELSRSCHRGTLNKTRNIYWLTAARLHIVQTAQL